jgi:gliding motility-associated lipoprotein GldH
MKAMNKGRFLPMALLALVFSCSGDRVFEEFHSFEQGLWNEKDSIRFDFKSVENRTGQKLVAVKFNENYPFANCYVRIISSDSVGKTLENRLINIPLFDSKTGQPLGKGFGNTFTKYDTLPISIPEQASQVSLVQYMRQEELPGIEAVGFKILK